jgi:hypothetical protein
MKRDDEAGPILLISYAADEIAGLLPPGVSNHVSATCNNITLTRHLFSSRYLEYPLHMPQ